MKNMHSKGEIINTKTFDIINDDTIVSVDRSLARSISILNKKGYYTEHANLAKITTLFSITNLLYELKQNNLINIKNNEQTIKNIIESTIHEATSIMFKENYIFSNIPEGFIYDHNTLFYFIIVLKDSDNIEFKELLEMDKEREKSIQLLEEWANSLPEINGGKNV